MREILFRGKREDNGEWVYGAFMPNEVELIDGYRGFEDIPEVDGIILNYSGNDRKVETFIVDRKTVSEYSGYNDINGIKIFEGDIVSAKRSMLFNNGLEKVEDTTKGNEVGKVYFDDGAFWIMWESDCFDEDSVSFFEGEVIGNIYDNPELLEGE